MDDEVMAWHWLPPNRRLTTGELVKAGDVFHITHKVVLCQSGHHASLTPLDALVFADGPHICRVALSGDIVYGYQILAAQIRRVLWVEDASKPLHEFALWCAEESIRHKTLHNIFVAKEAHDAIRAKRAWLDGQLDDHALDLINDEAWRTVEGRCAACCWASSRTYPWASALNAARVMARVFFPHEPDKWAHLWKRQCEELEIRIMVQHDNPAFLATTTT